MFLWITRENLELAPPQELSHYYLSLSFFLSFSLLNYIMFISLSFIEDGDRIGIQSKQIYRFLNSHCSLFYCNCHFRVYTGMIIYNNWWMHYWQILRNGCWIRICLLIIYCVCPNSPSKKFVILYTAVLVLK